MEGESSAEHRAVAGAWGAWLIQIGCRGGRATPVDVRRAGPRRRGGASARGFCHGGGGGVVAARLPGSHRRGDRADRGGGGPCSPTQPDRWLQAFVDWVRSGLALKMGDADRGRRSCLRGSVAGFAAEGDRYGKAIASIRLGELAELRGDYDEAIALTTFAYEATMSTGPGANASILATRLGNLAANCRVDFDDAAHMARDRPVTGPGVGVSRVRPRRR